MLLNNLDPDVAEKPEELIVYGGRGKAARNFESLDLIIKGLKQLESNETLLVQSGKPVGILQTHENAPRVLISNSQLVPNWANWKHFDDLEQKGLIMYGQMTAGSWIYIGSQGIVQGTYETFGAVANKHFNGSLKGTISVTAGLGGMGGAQPLAITMNEGVCLAAEVEKWRIEKRLETKYIDVMVEDIDEAIDVAWQAKKDRKALSIGVVCNAVALLERLIERQGLREIVKMIGIDKVSKILETPPLQLIRDFFLDKTFSIDDFNINTGGYDFSFEIIDIDEEGDDVEPVPAPKKTIVKKKIVTKAK
jgi:urocanate hydratase